MTNFRRLSALLLAAVLVSASCGGDEDTTSDAAANPVSADDTDPGGSPAPDASGAVECPPIEGAAEQTRVFEQPPPNCLEDGVAYDAVLTTNMGEFTVELDPATAPVAANNFVFLARNLYFDDMVCHRIIPNFVVQCGDPTATGTGGPGYTIVDEPPTVPYQLGSVAMAKRTDPNSAGSQFFIITGSDGAALPPEYALFGQVVDGFDTTVAAMAAAGTPDGTPSEPVEIQSVRIVQR